MELTQIKTSVFGYKKIEVCQYISEINELHASELEAASTRTAELSGKLEAAEKSIIAEKDTNSELNAEIQRLNEELKNSRSKNAELEERIEALELESENYREKSAAISTAIINAEKCAVAVLDEANAKAEDMISDAVSKVDFHTGRMTAAKEYIAELRRAISDTLKKMDAELGDAEKSIERKKSYINSAEFNSSKSEKANSDDNANSSRDRFGIFRRA